MRWWSHSHLPVSISENVYTFALIPTNKWYMVIPLQLTVLITAIGYPCRTYTMSISHRNPQQLKLSSIWIEFWLILHLILFLQYQRYLLPFLSFHALKGKKERGKEIPFRDKRKLHKILTTEISCSIMIYQNLLQHSYLYVHKANYN